MDAVGGAQVGLHLLHRRAAAAELLRGGREAGVLGSHDEVEAVVGELARQLEADAAGGTGDEREWLLSVM